MSPSSSVSGGSSNAARDKLPAFPGTSQNEAPGSTAVLQRPIATDPTQTSDAMVRMNATHERLLFECNDFFTALTGYSNADLAELTRWTRDGFLPWGGDVYALLAASDDAVLQFLRLCSVNFAKQGRPAGFPAMRRIDVTVDAVIIAKNGTKLPTIMTATIVEGLSLERTTVDVAFVFQYSPPNSAYLKDTHILSLDAPIFEATKAPMCNFSDDTSGAPPTDLGLGLSSLGSLPSTPASDVSSDKWFDELLEWVDDRDLQLR